MALALTEALLQTDLRQSIGDDADTFSDRRLRRALITGLARLARRRSWSFHRDTYPVNTITPYSTGTIAVSVGGTVVTGTTTVFPSNIVSSNAWIEFAGQRRAYEITVRGGDTSLTIRTAYGHADPTNNLSGATYRIFYPSIDLPANFKSLRKVLDDARSSELEIVESDEMGAEHADYAGVGSPYWCSVRAKRNDPNVSQLWMYPPPNTQELYTILYNRIPGWYDSSTVATANFTLEPATTSYFVDWPLMLKDVLLASARLSLVSEGAKSLDYGIVNADYAELVRAAESDDERQPEHEWLGRVKHQASETWRIGT